MNMDDGRHLVPHQFPSTGSCPFAGQKSHVALIHVGKTAGMTVENLLSLAGVNHTQVHTKNAHLAVDCHFTHYIVTTRDPINRTISAFNWRCEPRWRATIEWRDLGGAAGAVHTAQGQPHWHPAGRAHPAGQAQAA